MSRQARIGSYMKTLMPLGRRLAIFSILALLLLGTGADGFEQSNRGARPSNSDRSGQEDLGDLRNAPRLVTRLNADIKTALRNGDSNRALQAALKKLEIAIKAPRRFPRIAWTRTSCEVINDAFNGELNNKDQTRIEIGALFAEAITGLRQVDDPRFFEQNTELLRVVASSRYHLLGELAPEEIATLSNALASEYSYRRGLNQTRVSERDLQRLAGDFAKLEQDLRDQELESVNAELYADVLLGTCECRFLLSEWQQAWALLHDASDIWSASEFQADGEHLIRLERLQNVLSNFAPTDAVAQRELRWLQELPAHGVYLTVEEPTTDPANNAALEAKGISASKVQQQFDEWLRSQGIESYSSVEEWHEQMLDGNPGIMINVRVGATMSESLNLGMYAIHIDVSQRVVIPGAEAKIQFATLYSPDTFVGAGQLDRFADEAFEALSDCLNKFAKDLATSRRLPRLDPSDRALAAQEDVQGIDEIARLLAADATSDEIGRYMRRNFLRQVADEGVFVSDNLFQSLVSEQPWFARNGYTSEGLSRTVESQLNQLGVKTLSAIDANRRLLAGEHVCWLSILPQVVNRRDAQEELTAYAIELVLQQPMAYLVHAGEKPHVGRISNDGTDQRRLGAGLDSMKPQFDQDLRELVNRFAEKLKEASND